jgi:hypothetical protein
MAHPVGETRPPDRSGLRVFPRAQKHPSPTSRRGCGNERWLGGSGRRERWLAAPEDRQELILDLVHRPVAINTVHQPVTPIVL